MGNEKDAISIGGVNSGDVAKQTRIDNLQPEAKAQVQGVAGAALWEPIPSFVQCTGDKVWDGANNSSIVLGRDRLKSRASGYGGRGNTQCGSIDIVVGRMGALARSANSQGKRTWVNPNVTSDAARIYISQKTDLDANFYCPEGKVGCPTARSGIALKADGIRIIAREGLKLVTGVDGVNSQDGDIDSVHGIDLIIANVEDELQPIPRGDNVMLAIERLAVHLDALNGLVDAFMMYQKKFNDVIAHHTHHGPGPITTVPFAPGFIWETTPCLPLQSGGIICDWNLTAKVKLDLATCKANIGTYQASFLTPGGGNYINSRYCHVT